MSVFENLTDTPTPSVTITQPLNTLIPVTPSSTPARFPVPTSTLLPPEPYKPVNPRWELPPDLISSLHDSCDGTVWLQTEHQVFIPQENNWVVALDEIPGEILGSDQSGLVWTLSPDGSTISSWEGTMWDNYGDGLGWISVNEHSFIRDDPIPDQYGQVGIVTLEDLHVFDGQIWTRFIPKDLGLSLPLELERDVLPDINRTYLENSVQLWLGSCNWTGSVFGSRVMGVKGLSYSDSTQSPSVSSIYICALRVSIKPFGSMEMLSSNV